MRHADRPTVADEIRIAADPDTVWPIVTDLPLLAGFSSELQTVAWADGADGPPRVGRQFTGLNRNDYFGEWTTTATVVACEPPAVLSWAVGDPDEPNTSWGFELTAVADGATVLRQWAQLGTGPSGLTVAIARSPEKEERIVAHRLDYFRTSLQANLEGIRAAVEARAS